MVRSGDVTPVADDRFTPDLPLAAGTRIYTTNSGCTSFAVRITQPKPALPKPRGALTAAHCGNYGAGFWRTANNYFFGNKRSEYQNTARDAAILTNDQITSGLPDTYRFYGPYMYVGGVSGASRYVVTGGAMPVVGADFCYSGSYSGTWCYNEIEATNVYVDYGGAGKNTGPLVRTRNYKGISAVGQGDSGGPAFQFNSTTTNGVRATGIISGISGGSTTGCRGEQYKDRLRSTVALISPIYSAMSGIGAGIQLSTSTNP